MTDMIVEILIIIIWGTFTLGLLVVLIRDGLKILVYSNINAALNGRITRLYRVGMHESGDILKLQYIKSWRDLFKRYF